MVLLLGDVVLRPLLKGDATDIARLLNNKKIWDNLRDYIPFPYSKRDAETFIDTCISQSTPTTFVIVFKDEFCGIIGINLQNDIYRMSAEVGYWIGEPFWGKGIATTALSAITGYGFKTLKLERIFAGTFGTNETSQKVLEKCGYLKECVARNAVIKNDLIMDEHRYAILKSDHSNN